MKILQQLRKAMRLTSMTTVMPMMQTKSIADILSKLRMMRALKGNLKEE
jgi:hypothetical protein